MRTLTDEEKERLMNELIQSINDKYIKHSYEMTTSEFAEKIGRSYSYTKRLLSAQVKEGKMTKRKVTIDGKTWVVYSMI